MRPSPAFALGEWAYISRKTAEWSKFDEQERELTAAAHAGVSTLDPFTFLLFSDNPADISAYTRGYCAGRNIASIPKIRHDPRRQPREKIRVGYVSADFRFRPSTLLLTDLIETHDRSRFEIFGVSIGTNDDTPERRRIAAAFDRFIDATDWRIDDIAEKLRALDPSTYWST